MEDRFNLNRFVVAQEEFDSYTTAWTEIRSGRKTTHWIWYVLPQVAGLGRSAMSREYAISGIEEARAYLAHPLLGRRLREITDLATRHAPRSAGDIFLDDDVKFRSCVTLFSMAAPEEPVFRTALEVFFGGRADERTLEILAAQGAAGDGA